MTRLGLLLVVALIAGACDASPSPPSPVVFPNEPVPLPADLAALAADVMFGGGDRLEPAAPLTPPISPARAVEIAGPELLAILRSNKLPEQDPAAPDALVRRHYVGSLTGPADVWVVAYRWKAGWNCQHPEFHGPGNCRMASFYFIDERTGELVQQFTATLQAAVAPRRPAGRPVM